MFVSFHTDMREETLLRCLIACFTTIGGVPWVVVTDNMKTAVLGRNAQHEPVWNPAYQKLAVEFKFHPEACAPGVSETFDHHNQHRHIAWGLRSLQGSLWVTKSVNAWVCLLWGLFPSYFTSFTAYRTVTRSPAYLTRCCWRTLKSKQPPFREQRKVRYEFEREGSPPARLLFAPC